MKKVIPFLLILLLCLQLVSAAAWTNDALVYNESFNNYVTNDRPALDINTTDYYIKEYETQNKGLAINLKPGRTRYQISLEKIVEQEFCISFDLMGQNESFEGELELADNVSGSQSLLTFHYDKTIKLHNGMKLCGYGYQSPVNIVLAVNIKKQQYSIYVDGELKISNYRITAMALRNLSAASFVFRSINENSAVILDNINVNLGSRPIKYPEANFNEIETTLTEIESTPSNKILINNDYEKQGSYSLPAYYNNIAEVVKDGDNYCLRVEKVSYDQIQNVNNFSTEADSLVCEQQIKLLGEATTLYLDIIRDVNGVVNQPLAISNLTLTADGDPIAKLRIGKWYKIACVYKFGYGTYDVYVDDDLVLQDKEYANQDFTVPCRLDWMVRSGNLMGKVEFYIDNYYLYEGDKPREINLAFSLNEENNIFPSDSAQRSILGSNIGIHLRSGVKYVQGKKTMMDTKPYLEDGVGMVPLEELAEIFNIAYSFDEASGKASLGEIDIYLGRDTILTDGGEIQLDRAAQIRDGKIYVPIKEICEKVLNKQVYVDDKATINSGMVIISDTAFVPPQEEAKLQELNDYLFYLRPTAEDIKDVYANSGMEQQHPRIFATKEDIGRVLTEAELYQEKANVVKNIIETGDSALSRAVIPAGRNGTESDAEKITRTDYPNAVQPLAFAYGLTKDKKYADRAYEHMKAICSWSNWGSNSYLQVASVVLTTAIGYDWIYDALTPEQRTVIEEGMLANGLEEAEYWYYGFKGDPARWAMAENNWNIVCNGSTAVAALAFMDVFPDVCARDLSNALRGIETCIKNYAPSGLWYEGPGYWNYATSHFVYLLSGLDTVLKTDFGLTTLQGLDNTMNYVFHVQSPSGGMFNFADSGNGGSLYSSFMHYFAKKYNRPEISQMLLKQSPNSSGGIFGLLWCDPKIKEEVPTLEKDAYFPGRTELITARESWEDNETTYFAMKGGEAVREHSHLDLGTFVYDSGGVRWAAELGGESYVLGGYWDTAFGRWKTLRTRAEGHNTLVFNPGADPRDQDLQADAKFTRFESKPKGMISILDLSSAYPNFADSVRRGYFLTDDRRSAVIRDEISLTGSSDIYWMMYTQAKEAEINGNTVILKKNDKSIKLEFICNKPTEVVFENAEPLPGTETVAGQSTNEEFKRFALKIQGSGQVTVTVKLTPDGCPQTPIADYDVNMDLWQIPDGEMIEKPYVNDIKINGQTVEGFDKYRSTYTYNYLEGATEKPEITVFANENSIVTVEDESPYEKPVVITVYNKEYPEFTFTYFIDFKKINQSTKFMSYNSLYINSYEALEVQATAPPSNMFDGDIETRYAIAGDADIILDMGIVNSIDGLIMAFWKGNERKQIFEIGVSTDGENYNTVFNGMASGTTEGYEEFMFERTEARYVRIRLHGTTTGNWNSVNEVVIVQK